MSFRAPLSEAPFSFGGGSGRKRPAQETHPEGGWPGRGALRCRERELWLLEEGGDAVGDDLGVEAGSCCAECSAVTRGGYGLAEGCGECCGVAGGYEEAFGGVGDDVALSSAVCCYGVGAGGLAFDEGAGEGLVV